MRALPQQTGKQQRTFGSFYFAIDHPFTFPFRQRLRLDLIRHDRASQANLYKLLTHGFRFGGKSILCLSVDGDK